MNLLRLIAALTLLAEPTATLAVALDRDVESCCADEASGHEPSNDPCVPGCADCVCCPHARTMTLALDVALAVPGAAPVALYPATSGEPLQPEPAKIPHVPKHDA